MFIVELGGMCDEAQLRGLRVVRACSLNNVFSEAGDGSGLTS